MKKNLDFIIFRGKKNIHQQTIGEILYSKHALSYGNVLNHILVHTQFIVHCRYMFRGQFTITETP